MFYSHEILTDRQHGVATIWLVATLGSKSNLKKLSRRAILDVDVPKACETITDPVAPMALRLQGSLLYGVSRVFSQQCGYVLADSQSYRDKMRGIAQELKNMEIDSEMGRSRPELLNLSDDPAFVPELDINFDLSLFDSSFDVPQSTGQQFDSPYTSSKSGLPAENIEEQSLVLPSMDTYVDFGGFDDNFGISADSSIRTRARDNLHEVLEESALDLYPGFEFDVDGNLIEIDQSGEKQTQRNETVVSNERGLFDKPDIISKKGDGLDLEQVSQRVNNGHDTNDDGFFGGDDESLLPQAEPFPSREFEMAIRTDNEPASSLSADHKQESGATVTAEAPQQRQRHSRKIVIDNNAELLNRQLGEWNHNYLANMTVAAHLKHRNKSVAQAKKNAAFWMLEQGIGGVMVNFGDDREPHPLSVFSGHSLIDAILGQQSSPMRAKRMRDEFPRDESEDQDMTARRVRAKTELATDLARNTGSELGIDEHDGIIFQDDDYNIESEVGREAPTSLQDQSQVLPWNISSSRQTSRKRFGSVAPVISSSFGGVAPGAVELGPPSVFGRHRSRLTTASPLDGRGTIRLSDLELSNTSQEGSDHGDIHTDEVLIEEGMALNDFELYGPAAVVDTQTAAQKQWIAATLESEAHNFLIFLDTQIQVRSRQGNAIEREGMQSITLDELLPATRNTKVVAAQALLHVLTLTTKGILEVHQEEPFGDITMSLPSAYLDDEDDGMKQS